MSFFQPRPVFDFLTGTDNKNAMPWKDRHNLNLTKHEWSAPLPLILDATSAEACEEQAQQLCQDPSLLILGISPATCAIGPKGIEQWSLTLIVQRRLT